jgi:hypothetical protein
MTYSEPDVRDNFAEKLEMLTKVLLSAIMYVRQ